MTINVTKYRLNPDRIFAGTRGSYGMEKLSFDFGEGWESFDTISVTFHPKSRKPIRVPLFADTAEIDIPAEVMDYSGESEFVVSGENLNGEEVEQKAITLAGVICVAQTAGDKGGNSRKVTPDTYDLFLAEANEHVEKKLEEAKASGAFKGDPGEKGHPGEKGGRGDPGMDAYEIAKQYGYAGTREEFGQDQAGFAENAAQVRIDREAADQAAAEAEASAGAAHTDAERAEEYHEGAVLARDAAVGAANTALAAQQSVDRMLDRVEEHSAKVENTAANIEQTVQDALREAKDSGEFNGDTPYIGTNGNWWIGNVDTGVKAGGTVTSVNGILPDENGNVEIELPEGGTGGGTGGGITTETDPTVPDWAKQPEKPTYTAEEVGALPANTPIPGKTSDLTNDSGFITKAVADLTNYYNKSQTYTQAEVNALVSAIPKFAISVVSALPTSGISTTTVYLVKSGSGGDLYTEYIRVNGVWEILGSQRVDLTGYATESWVNIKLADYISTAQLQGAIDTALAQAKTSGEFDGAPGKDYVLTDADKAEIAEQAAGLIDTALLSIIGSGEVTA